MGPTIQFAGPFYFPFHRDVPIPIRGHPCKPHKTYPKIAGCLEGVSWNQTMRELQEWQQLREEMAQLAAA
jgi:hypothetical protein